MIGFILFIVTYAFLSIVMPSHDLNALWGLEVLAALAVQQLYYTEGKQ